MRRREQVNPENQETPFHFEDGQAPEQENNGDVVIELVRRRTDEALTRLDGLNEIADDIEPNLSPQGQEKVYRFRINLARLNRNVWRVAGLMAALSAFNSVSNYKVGGAIEHGKDYMNSRYQVAREVDNEGSEVFQHEDKKTTQILDYLSGKGDLPKEEVGTMVSNTESDIKREYSTIPKDSKLKLTEQDIKLIAQWRVARPKYSQEMYEALWEIEQSSGNPKIRWLHYDGVNADTPNEPHRAFYDGRTNTMYIEPPGHTYSLPRGSIDDFLAEASHGHQWTKPVTNFIRREFSADVQLYLMKSHNLNSKAAREMLYDAPGTIEHQAHREIQPQLTEKIAKVERIQELKRKAEEATMNEQWEKDSKEYIRRQSAKNKKLGRKPGVLEITSGK